MKDKQFEDATYKMDALTPQDREFWDRVIAHSPACNHVAPNTAKTFMLSVDVPADAEPGDSYTMETEEKDGRLITTMEKDVKKDDKHSWMMKEAERAVKKTYVSNKPDLSSPYVRHIYNDDNSVCTVVGWLFGDIFHLSAAVCAKGDQFCKKTGRETAKQRFYISGPIMKLRYQPKFNSMQSKGSFFNDAANLINECYGKYPFLLPSLKPQ